MDTTQTPDATQVPGLPERWHYDRATESVYLDCQGERLHVASLEYCTLDRERVAALITAAPLLLEIAEHVTRLADDARTGGPIPAEMFEKIARPCRLLIRATRP